MVNSCSVFKCHNKANKSDDRKISGYRKLFFTKMTGPENYQRKGEDRGLRDSVKISQGKTLATSECAPIILFQGRNQAPSINLGSTASTPSPLVATGRFARRRARSERCEAARVLLSISESCEPPLEVEAGTSSQTDLSSQFMTLVIDSVFNELAHVKKENDSLREQLKTQTLYCIVLFKENDDKVKYFTGLTSFLVLMELFCYLESHLPAKVLLTKFQCFIMTLMKLRLDLSNVFSAYQFSVSTSTIFRTFEDYIHVMYHRMKPLVYWPDRECHCFEVFIDNQSNMLARAETWSSYKHNNTVKFLIGITPQG
ncbi:hypothetical protein MAR_037303, partial [Mya arenaria]